MENFFIEDKFYSDLDSLLEDMDLYELGDVEDLKDDWFEDCQESKLEKIFEVDEDFVLRTLLAATEDFDERFPDDQDQELDNRIKRAFMSGIDIKKINEALPEFYYPSGEKFRIAKQDLLDHFKTNN